jgi:hypothetical protein
MALVVELPGKCRVEFKPSISKKKRHFMTTHFSLLSVRLVYFYIVLLS